MCLSRYLIFESEYVLCMLLVHWHMYIYPELITSHSDSPTFTTPITPQLALLPRLIATLPRVRVKPAITMEGVLAWNW